MEKFSVLGLDIGGTKIAVSLGLTDGTLLASERLENRDRTPEAVIPELFQTAERLLAEHSEYPLKAVGVGSPSPIDIEKGLIVSPVNLPRWRNVPIVELFQTRFKVPVILENDANAAALAEWLFGAGKGCLNMIYIAVSTGIGGGFIVDGHLMRGHHANGAELHMSLDPQGEVCSCGIRGCYEALCGGRAVAMRLRRELCDKPNHRLVQMAGSVEKIDMIVLEKAVREGEPYACSVWDEMMMRHAQAVGMLLNIFNPEKIIFGTLADAAGNLFFDPLKHNLHRFAWGAPIRDCTLGSSALGRKIGELSAVAIAVNALREKQ